VIDNYFKIPIYKLSKMDKYQILGILGEGAYGIVYRARRKEDE